MSDALGIPQAALPRAIFFAERTPPREKAIDRIMVDLQSRVLTPFARFRARRLGRIVPQVGAHAARLKALDDDALRMLAREVRLSLRRHAKPRIGDVALCFALIREAAGRILGKQKFHSLVLEEPLVLLEDGISGLGENLHQGRFIQLIENANDGEAPDKFGNEAEFNQVLRLRLAQQLGIALCRQNTHLLRFFLG